MGDDLTKKIIGAAIEVHRILGPGLLEGIYEKALPHEFGHRMIAVQREIDVGVCSKDVVITGPRLDRWFENEVVIELKSLSRLPEVAVAQVISYLKATHLKRGLLINFGESFLKNEIKRISL